MLYLRVVVAPRIMAIIWAAVFFRIYNCVSGASNMTTLGESKVRPLRELKGSLWRAQYIGADPHLFDEFYQALKRKADLKRTAVIDTEVDRLDIVLTWDTE